MHNSTCVLSKFWRTISAVLIMGTASVLPISANLVTNGTFTGTPGQIGYNGSLTGWTGLGTEGAFGTPGRVPDFLFPATGGTQTGDSFFGNVSFFGNPSSPTSNDFVASDGDSTFAGGISQTVSGLTVGDTYTLTFEWAGAQQTGFSGNTTEKWGVTLGSQSQNTGTVNTPSQTFVGWQSASLNFTASSTSELLSFMAVGTPVGEPPWLLLSNVDLEDTTKSAAPEPMTGGLMLIAALIGLPVMYRLRRKRA